MLNQLNIFILVHSILGSWKSIIAGLSSFGESKAFIFLDSVHIRIDGESNILKKKKKLQTFSLSIILYLLLGYFCYILFFEYPILFFFTIWPGKRTRVLIATELAS